jgi:3-hydroxyethyl bacteriochlorophyllide a dehydrogenase
MPDFPGMGYPLVPGYETVGTVVEAGASANVKIGETVYVPGARCFGPVRGLFGGSAALLVSPAARVLPIAEHLGEKAILLALAATAYHAQAGASQTGGTLVVGHGVLGRLLARIVAIKSSEPPVVWERNPLRAEGAVGYSVVDPQEDPRRDYTTIYDVSGDAGLLDTLISRLGMGGEIVLAGFYESQLAFTFPPAFMREARLRVAAQWREADLFAVKDLIEAGTLSFDGLITHHRPAVDAVSAYPVAFNDPSCLKMVVDWRNCQ